MITTSYIDKDYFIFNSKDLNIFLLATILIEHNCQKLPNLLTENREELNKPLFIKKDTIFGKTIKALIEKNKIFDTTKELKEETILQALKYAIQNDNYSSYIPIISDLVKNNIQGSIEKLSIKYNEETLLIINKIGKYQKHLESNKEITGFEENGLIFDENNILCNFNINTKEKAKVKTKKK